MKNLPNIETLNHEFETILLKKRNATHRYIPDNETYVFPQTWPNTGGGFAEPGCMYGQAMTTEYTTVILNREDDAAVVFFGERPAYYVCPTPEEFWIDFDRRHMVGIAYKDRYRGESI